MGAGPPRWELALRDHRWLHEIVVRPFGERVRFLPDGSGIVYMKAVEVLRREKF